MYLHRCPETATKLILLNGAPLQAEWCAWAEQCPLDSRKGGLWDSDIERLTKPGWWFQMFFFFNFWYFHSLI